MNPNPNRTPLAFTKMHGLGNDFMVLDCTRAHLQLSDAQIRLLADRHFGVGFDQLLMVEPATRPDVDFRYRIFNADGSEVEQCGNGARCFARFVRDRGLSDKDLIRVETAAGVIELRLTPEGRVVVNMGVPKLLPAEIPFLADAPALLHRVEVNVDGGSEQVELAVVNMGNPHAVLFVESVDTAPVGRLGPLLESHPRFPARVNVGFMQVLARDRVKLRVFERGTGETLACGTGACAAVVAGRRRGLLDERVEVALPGGELRIEWPGENAPVLMAGPATRVYEGLWLWP
ncbi:diaminopimelate epimerase [Sterolibacterium denitrificans]|nr:diaminopimelate epimerase [Sterolibacterium denitrificans]